MHELLIVALSACGAIAVGMLMARRVPVSVDEAWFLQVVKRVATGERLYWDVFYGAGPLPVWLGQLAVRLGGINCGSIRGLATVLYAGFVSTVVASLWSLGGSVAIATGACLALLGLTGPAWPFDNVYGLVSRFGAGVSAMGLAEAGPTADRGWIAIVGIGVGVALLAKYSVGIAIAVVTSILVLLVHGVGPTLLLGCTAMTVAGAGFAILWRQNILRAFVSRAVKNKRTFLETGGISLWTGFDRIRPRAADPAFVRAARTVAAASFISVPIATLAVVTVSIDNLVGARQMWQVGPGLVCLAALFAGVFPRMDWDHVGPFSSMSLAGIAASAVIVGSGDGALDIVVGTIFGCAGAAGFVVALRTWRPRSNEDASLHPQFAFTPNSFEHSLPHFAGASTPWFISTELVAAGRTIRDMTGGAVFLLRPDAAVWYLVSDIRNPTPFDYPLASAFGPRGQAEVIESIASGSVVWCCLQPANFGALTPHALETYVREAMDCVATTALGALYRRRR